MACVVMLHITRVKAQHQSCGASAHMVRMPRTICVYVVLLPYNTTYKLSFALITMASDHKLMDLQIPCKYCLSYCFGLLIVLCEYKKHFSVFIKSIILCFSFHLFCFWESFFPVFLITCFINIDYILFKNKLYYNIRLELSFSERTLNVGCFHEFILKKGHTKCMSLIVFFVLFFQHQHFIFLLLMAEKFRRTQSLYQ